MLTLSLFAGYIGSGVFTFRALSAGRSLAAALGLSAVIAFGIAAGGSLG